MLKIRLTRRGKKKQPIYRIVVAEHTMPIKGKFIEILGFYNPRTKELVIKKEKIENWISNGAKPSDTVAALLRKEGFKLTEEFQKPKKYVKAKKEKKDAGQTVAKPVDKESPEEDIEPKEEKKPVTPVVSTENEDQNAKETKEEQKKENKPAEEPKKEKEQEKQGEQKK